MSDAERERKSQRIQRVFSIAAQKARHGIGPKFKLDFLPDPDGAVITVSAEGESKHVRIRFDVGANNGVIPAIEGKPMAGAGSLFEAGIEENIASVIRNVVAKEFA